MDIVVAIKVVDKEKGEGAFLTWGRLFGAVDEKKLIEVLSKHVSKWGIDHPVHYKLCYSLLDVSSYLYFYEGFFYFTQQKIPNGTKSYQEWVKKQKRDMKKGENICFLGFKSQKIPGM